MPSEKRLELLLDREQAVLETQRMKTRLHKAQLHKQLQWKISSSAIPVAWNGHLSSGWLTAIGSNSTIS